MVKNVDNAELPAAILHQLSKGKENAITGKILAQRLGMKDTRAIRNAMRDMIAQNHIMIGLSVHKPYGYYLINSHEELAECANTLKGYCIEAALHRRDLIRAANYHFEQMRMI